MLSLHIHSNYSLLEGIIPLDELIAFAKSQGEECLALTDTNNMYGLLQFARKAIDAGIKPILGTMIDEPSDKTLSVLLLARNNQGYAHICKIITTRKLKEDFSLRKLLGSDLKDLFIITSSAALLNAAEPNIQANRNVYAELIVTDRQKKKTRKLYEYARERGIPVVATHPAYFLRPEDYHLHKVVRAIDLNTTIENLKDDELVDEQFYLKSSSEIIDVWRTLPEALRNAEFIARNCNVELGLGKLKFPVFPLPAGETAFSYLWKICFRGLEERIWPITEKAVKRLQYELEVIGELGFSDYFLIVWDIVREAHRRGMMTIGRGSAANSLAAYCLNLTQVDPLEHNLYFERFLNRGRTSPPDVDLDFSWKERDEIVRYVFEKYGYDRVAMISTMITFKARSAFREVAKVFGLCDEEISRYSKYIPWTSAKNLEVLAEKFPESRSLNFQIEPWKSIIQTASRLGGFPRHLSIHPGGIIITETAITDYVALEYAKNKGAGLIITQPDMYPIEDMGLIKIDLLSQRSLGVLRDTLMKIDDNLPSAQTPGEVKIFHI